jgi:hypothetical protein
VAEKDNFSRTIAQDAHGITRLVNRGLEAEGSHGFDEKSCERAFFTREGGDFDHPVQQGDGVHG